MNCDLFFQIFDQKTEGEIGRLDYTLEQLLEKKDLEISSEPFTLQKAGSDSKIILSMQLRVSIHLVFLMFYLRGTDCSVLESYFS